MSDDATLVINPDGTYADATPAALAILGVSLDELRLMPRGAFAARPQDPDAAAAFRSSWEREGSPDIGGSATITRPDGEERRVAFRIVARDDGSFAAQLREVDAPTTAPTELFTAGQILAVWREAERRLEAISEEHPDFARIQTDIEGFRDAYQRAFHSVRGREQAT